MVNSIVDLRFYKKTGELLLNKSELKNDLIMTKAGALINPKVGFTSVDQPFKLISNNAIPSAAQARELKKMFDKSSLSLTVNMVYDYEQEGGKVKITLFERR